MTGARCEVGYGASAMGRKADSTKVRTPSRRTGRSGQSLTPEGQDAQRSARERERLWDAIKDVPESRPPTKPP